MANDEQRRRRNMQRRFRPMHDVLERRRMLSLGITMLGQSPILEQPTAASLNLASFSFSTTDSFTDYTASISWGDGTSSVGQIDTEGPGAAAVVGSHSYAAAGTESVTVTVTGDGTTASGVTEVDVLDAPLSAWAVSFAPTAGQSYSGAIAEFRDVNTSTPSSAFTASITWGDGGTSSGTIVPLGGGEFEVSGTHTYSSEGTYDLQVQVADDDGQSADAGIAVQSSGHSGSEYPVTGTGQTVSLTLGQSFSGTLAVFYGGTLSTSAGYTATVNWGDGTSSSGQFTIVPYYLNEAKITGSHTYSAAGEYPVTVTVAGANGDIATASTFATVVPQVLTLTGLNGTGTAGQMFDGTVATVADINPGDQPGNLTAVIVWGDGTQSDGLVVRGPVSGFDVVGSHTYAEPATYPVTVNVSDAAGATATVNGTAAIADAALAGYGSGVQATEGSALSQAIATIVSDNPDGQASDLTATINWGDGTSVTTGTISAVASAPGQYTVSGSHTYAVAGTYTYVIDVVDHGGSTATIDGTAVVAAAALSLSSVTFSTTAGSTYSGNVATFTDANADAAAGNFTAAINWGDGTETAGTVAINGAGGFKVTGSHAYAARLLGSYDVTVQVAGPGEALEVVEEKATVTDATITPTALAISASDAASFTGEIATFTDGNSYATTADFTAIITWSSGGTTTIGTVTADPTVPGQFDVTGTNAYASTGTFTTSVEIIDQEGGKVMVSGTASVTEPTPVVTTVPVSAQAGTSFSGAVASFIAGGNDPTSDFTATINWGDGTSSTTGTIISPTTTADQFAVTGNHTYSSLGSDTITVTVTQTTGAKASASGTGTAFVSNMAVTPLSLTPTEGSSFSGDVASFTDSAITSSTGFTATVNWGDGTTASSGTVTYASGQFNVSGTHTYVTAGTFPTSIEITDPDGAEVTVQGTAAVPDAAISLSSLAISTSEGATFTGNVATFTDANPDAVATDFGALAEWGVTVKQFIFPVFGSSGKLQGSWTTESNNF